MHRVLAVAICACVPAFASSQAPTHTITGVAWDSLRSDPLGGAQVIVRGSGRHATADARGRFLIDSVPAGTHVLEVLHPSIELVGLSGLAITIEVPGSPVTAAIPSFATFWGRACGTRAPPDSGLVYGRVRDAISGRPVERALVVVTWSEILVSDSNQVSQRRWRAEAVSDSTGLYGICGIPDDDGIRVVAAAAGHAPSIIDLLSRRLQRRDLLLAPDGAGEPARGVVTGRVTNAQGHPVPARVVVDGAAEVRTDANGTFIARAVPVGTRQLEVLSLGKAPAAYSVDVFAGDTAYVDAALTGITVLEGITVTASVRGRYLSQQFEQRRATGLGYIRDSTQLRPVGTLQGVFGALPGVRVRTRAGGYVLMLPGARGGECLATLYIDNTRAEHDELLFLRPFDIGAVEVYPRALQTPLRYPGQGCGSVVVWTRWAFR